MAAANAVRRRVFISHRLVIVVADCLPYETFATGSCCRTSDRAIGASDPTRVRPSALSPDRNVPVAGTRYQPLLSRTRFHASVIFCVVSVATRIISSGNPFETSLSGWCWLIRRR